MKVRFFGVRGSLPSPISPAEVQNKVKSVVNDILTDPKYKDKTAGDVMKMLPYYKRATYGGNTSCLLLEIGSEKIIIDCGSGMRVLGNYLLGSEFGKGQGSAKVFISHTHWDHIMGLPYFIPLFIPGNKFEFYSGHPGLEERLRYQQNFKFFPINLDYMQATKKFAQLIAGKEKIFENFSVVCRKQNHPGVSYAFRFEAEGKKFIYSTDVEYNYKNMEDLQEAVDFYRDADVLILDSQYTLVEQLEKIDYGHTSLQVGLDIAHQAKIKKIVLFHHDPMCSDEKMFEILKMAQSYKKVQCPNSDFSVIASSEGLVIDI